MRDIHVHSNVLGLCAKSYSEPNPCGWNAGLNLKTALTRGGTIENIMIRNNTLINSTFIHLVTNYQSGDKMPVGYPATRIRNVSWVGNVGHSGASWGCSVNDTCKDITVINNTAIGAGLNPWHCKFVETFKVSGNTPDGLPDCMKNSMNRTVASIMV